MKKVFWDDPYQRTLETKVADVSGAPQAYNSLCAEFYDLTKPLASGEEVAFYKDRLHGKSILEAMCGSGRLLIPLLKSGLRVDGVDFSAAMLANCRERLKQENLTATLYEQPIEGIALPQKYDAIIIAIGSFQLLHPRDKAFDALAKMKDCLNPDGQIFIETFIPWEALYENAASEKDDREADVDQTTKIHLHSVNQADKLQQFYHSKGVYQKIQHGKVTDNEEEEIYVNWYYRYEMLYFLEKAGFQNIEICDVNFAQNPNGIVYRGENR